MCTTPKAQGHFDVDAEVFFGMFAGLLLASVAWDYAWEYTAMHIL